MKQSRFTVCIPSAQSPSSVHSLFENRTTCQLLLSLCRYVTDLDCGKSSTLLVFETNGKSCVIFSWWHGVGQ